MASATQPRRRRYWGELFFIKRRPRLLGIPLDWERPTTPEAYAKLLDEEGFVTVTGWKTDDIQQYPIIKQDLDDLDEYLLPTFFEFSQKSKYYQNRFYLYQWVFIFGAFITTVLGTLATLFYSIDPAGRDQYAALQQSLSYATAAVGAVTAFVTALSNRNEPQKRWAKSRRLAEELRMIYFQYLSHLQPFHEPDRVQRLREQVIDIRVKERENA
jgi:hypothetical protein